MHQPTLNACLNGASALLLLTGYIFIRKRRIQAHRACMLAACLTSAAFLTSYLIYHAQHGATRYLKTGLVRGIYFTILISHTILAVVILPLIIMTLTWALKNSLEKHRKIARVTFPLWMYVSVTGVVVYWMLYRM